MASTFTMQCQWCGSKHELYRPMNRMDQITKSYEFICPKMPSRVTLDRIDPNQWKTVDSKPTDSVDVYEVHRR
jgi:hypothetical protein